MLNQKLGDVEFAKKILILGITDIITISDFQY